MKKNSLIALFIVASFFCIAKQSSAAVLFDVSWVSQLSSTSNLGTTASNVFYGYANDPSTTIFNDIALTAAAIGQTFTVDATNPNFANFVAKATDGINDMATWGYQWGSVDGGGNFTNPAVTWAISNNPESSLWSTFFIGASTPFPFPVDLQGYIIDSIQLTLDGYQEGNLPPGFSRTIGYTIKINGSAVPEPTSFVLFGLSLLGLAFKRFKS